MTKVDAIKQALAAGVDKPIDGVNYIGERFAISVTPGMFSTTKSQLKRKGGGGNGRRKGGRRKAEAQPETAPAAAGVSLADAARAVTAVQGLVQQFGKTAIKNLVDQVG